MKLDYKDSYRKPRQASAQKPAGAKHQWVKSWRLHSVIIASAAVCSFLFLVESDQSEASVEAISVPVASDLAPLESQSVQSGSLNRFKLSLPGQNTIERNSAASATDETRAVVNAQDSFPAWESAKVKSGDSLARIAHRNGIQSVDIHNLMQEGEDIQVLTRIRPGEEIRFTKTLDGALDKLEYDISETERLNVARLESGFDVSIVNRPFDVIENRKTATIESSLYGAAKSAGLSDNIIMELANIYGYDIDFALDVRKGDTFTVIWEEYYRDGEKIKDGDIVAAEFVNVDRNIRAVKYTDPAGKSDYYTPEGKSLRKAFLRSPVHFTRISSKFNPNRLHPIFKTKRPHRGVDYAAKTGTPIYAAGDGKVIHRGKKGGYGNTVIIQHGQKYNTLYAHMSRFNRKVKHGSRVKQGQVIGYVGSTGWATGPHLHYEFRVNGTHRNPLTVALPSAAPLNKKYKEDFAQTIQPLMAQLDTLSKTQLASAEF